MSAPKSASRRIEEYNVEDEFGAKDCLGLDLKADHDNRPLWIVCLMKKALLTIMYRKSTNILI